MNYSHHYTRFPALKSYIDRVGAEQLNFRRFMVKEYHGKYYIEKVLIKINADFSIECRDEKYLPDAAEAAAIVAELQKADFPTYVKASPDQVDELLRSGAVTGQLQPFYDNDRKKVLMCQERREGKEGKYYIPWSLYAGKDGEGIWETMEPDGPLPFWKPYQRRKKGNIMVHEGAKTAAFVDGLLNDASRKIEKQEYPKEWIDELEDYEHFGAIGGALAMHRCDFEELHKMQIEGHIVYSCDNDAAGVEASKVFSRNMTGKEVRVIKYDSIFRPGWDLADPLPPELFKNGRITRTLMSMCKPATWVTQVAAKEKKGKGSSTKSYTLTMKFREEWYHCTDVNMFFHTILPGQEYDEKGFNCFVRPYSDVDDTARLVRTSEWGKVAKVNYDPARAWGPYNKGAGKNTYFNRYVAQKFKDYSPAEAKRLDHSLLIDFYEQLVPDPGDRLETIRWCATLATRPDIKMYYSMLMASEMQGVGKTTVGHILEGIIGEHNVTWPNEKAIFDERNTFAGYKRLIIVSEIYAGKSSVMYNTLKSLITEKQIWVNPKYVPEHQVDNHTHLLLNSNSLVPLRFDNTDRRLFVPKVTEEKRPKSYWIKFYDWLENKDGYRQARQFFLEFLKSNDPVMPGAAAPDSTAKIEMIIRGYCPTLEKVQRALEWVKDPSDEQLDGQQAEMARIRKVVRDGGGVSVIAFDKDVVVAADRLSNRDRVWDQTIQKAAAVGRVARTAGFHVGQDRNNSSRFTPNARVLSLNEGLAKTRIVDLVRMLDQDQVTYCRLDEIMDEQEKL